MHASQLRDFYWWWRWGSLPDLSFFVQLPYYICASHDPIKSPRGPPTTLPLLWSYNMLCSHFYITEHWREDLPRAMSLISNTGTGQQCGTQDRISLSHTERIFAPKTITSSLQAVISAYLGRTSVAHQKTDHFTMIPTFPSEVTAGLQIHLWNRFP